MIGQLTLRPSCDISVQQAHAGNGRHRSRPARYSLRCRHRPSARAACAAPAHRRPRTWRSSLTRQLPLPTPRRQFRSPRRRPPPTASATAAAAPTSAAAAAAQGPRRSAARRGPRPPRPPPRSRRPCHPSRSPTRRRPKPNRRAGSRGLRGAARRRRGRAAVTARAAGAACAVGKRAHSARPARAGGPCSGTLRINNFSIQMTPARAASLPRSADFFLANAKSS